MIGAGAYAEQGGERLVERVGVAVDVGLGGRRRHQRHVVERRHQHAPVHDPEVEQALQVGVGVRDLVRAVARRLGHEVVLGAGAEAGHAPGRAVPLRSTSFAPRSQRSASGIIRANAASVRTSPRAARAAAIESA